MMLKEISVQNNEHFFAKFNIVIIWVIYGAYFEKRFYLDYFLQCHSRNYAHHDCRKVKAEILRDSYFTEIISHCEMKTLSSVRFGLIKYHFFPYFLINRPSGMKFKISWLFSFFTSALLTHRSLRHTVKPRWHQSVWNPGAFCYLYSVL